MFELNGAVNSAKIFTDNCDNETISQLITLLNQEFTAGSKIRIMPDCHAGAGCVIGTTMTITDKVVPNLVGVDIGCGMYVAELSESEIDFAKLDEIINTRVPAGFSVRGTAHPFLHASGLDRKLQELHCIEKLTNYDRLLLSLGTLGGGNHFIEVDRNEKGNLVIVIHSGSRNLGKQVAEVYQKQAFDELSSHKAEIDEIIATLKAQHRETEIEAEIQQIKKLNVPKDLAFLQGQSFESYIHDIRIIQEFAVWNRKAMMDEILRGMGLTTVNEFTTIHNYIDTEHMILRKGSVSARAGEQLIIPINMRDGSLICTGKGNDDWNQSAPHGAGRLMSRSQAKANVSMDEFTEAMTGIYSTSVCTSTLDESPMAYKPMDEIIENVQGTVEIDQIIKPVYNFKAH